MNDLMGDILDGNGERAYTHLALMLVRMVGLASISVDVNKYF
jgi:hypothetical protein